MEFISFKCFREFTNAINNFELTVRVSNIVDLCHKQHHDGTKNKNTEQQFVISIIGNDKTVSHQISAAEYVRLRILLENINDEQVAIINQNIKDFDDKIELDKL